MTSSFTSIPSGLHATMVARQALDRRLEEPGEADKIPDLVAGCVHHPAKEGEDFRLCFPKIAALLSHPATHDITRKELMADFAREDGGVWRPAIDAVATKAQRDSLDVVCLLAAHTILEQVFDGFAREKQFEKTGEIRKIMADIRPTLTVAAKLDGMLKRRDSIGADQYNAEIADLETRIDKELGLTPAASADVGIVLAEKIVDNFTRAFTVGNQVKSIYPIVRDVARMEGNGIDAQRDLPSWGEALAWAIRELDKERRKAAIHRITDKVIRDVSTYLVEKYPVDKGIDYEAIMRGGVIEFLRQLGLSVEERAATYRAIPHFAVDPPARPYLRTLGTHYLPIIREEFTLIGSLSEAPVV